MKQTTEKEAVAQDDGKSTWLKTIFIRPGNRASQSTNGAPNHTHTQETPQ